MLLDLAKEAGLDPKRKASTYGGEYFSPCPKCGGSDRFLIWPLKRGVKIDGTYWCRNCNIRGDCIQFCVDILGMAYPDAFRRCGIENQENKNYFKPFNIPSANESRDYQANKTWQLEMESLIDWAHSSIWKRSKALDLLNKRGIPEDAIKLYKLGYLPCTAIYKRPSLKLPFSTQGKDSVWIPRGITIPTFENGKAVRLKIRRADWTPLDQMQKYIAISGSLGGLNLIGDRTKDTIIAVESELDAFALHWIVKDKALVIAVGSNIKHPDSMTHNLVKKAEKLLVVHDNDEGGVAMLKKWSELYSHAIGCPVPLGKDIGEAFEKGFDLESWIKSFL